MPDGHPLRLGVSDVVVDVALGVDDDGGLRRLVADQVRRVGEAAQIVLLQQHEEAPGTGSATRRPRGKVWSFSPAGKMQGRSGGLFGPPDRRR